MKSLDKQLTWNRKELAAVSGRSLKVVDKWIYDGCPCFKEGHTYVFERVSTLEWLKARATARTGMVRKKPTYDEELFGKMKLV